MGNLHKLFADVMFTGSTNIKKRKLPANIYLTGFMGAGKTSAGRLLAAKLDVVHYDTDEIIVLALGMSIEKIFTSRGETYFRDTETALLKFLGENTSGNCIISTGGGIVERQENIDMMRENGLVVFLDVSAEEVCRRLSGVTDRPLLNTPDPGASVNELLKKRRPFYRQADVTVETSNKTIKETVEIIISNIEGWRDAGEEKITGASRPQS